MIETQHLKNIVIFIQTILCFVLSRKNLYWTMKFLKQTTYISYALAELSKFVKTSTLSSFDCFLELIP